MIDPKQKYKYTQIQIYKNTGYRKGDIGVGHDDGDDRPQTEIQKTDIQMYKNTD